MLFVVLAAGLGCDSGVGSSIFLVPAEPRDAVNVPGAPRSATPFAEAMSLRLDVTGAVRAQGRISGPDDYHVFDIGSVPAGDHLVVRVQPLDRGFDPAVAIFDEHRAALWINDDRVALRQLDAYADLVLRRDTAHCYVVVAASPASDTAGEYLLSVSVSPGSPPPPRSQIIYLDFEGATGVRIASNPPVDVPVFSAGLIDPTLRPQTDALIEMVVGRVRRDFAPYDVFIVSSRESPPPIEAHSTVYMGSYNPSLLGIADNVDTFNTRPVQEAIVFVDTFEVFMGLDPSLDMLADAMANVTSHEIGHLLGLSHTRDPAGIMDTSATLRQMMVAQAFRTSPLHPETFVIGRQDAPATLLDTVGGDPDRAAIAAAAKVSPPTDGEPREAARSRWIFGTGCRGHGP